MKRKRSSKLSLSRETLKQLDRSDLRVVAGATAQIGCPNTANTCKTCGTETCESCISCFSCPCETSGCPSQGPICETTITL